MTSKSIPPSHAALTALLVLWKFQVSTCQVLRAEYAKIPLPSPDFGKSPVFDGDESIYLLGGVGAWRRILRFNISTETIEQVGELLYGNDLGQNGAAINSNGKIFSIGGGLIDGIGRVQSFDPSQDIVSKNLSNLPYDISAGSRIPLEGGDQVLIVGGSLAGFNLDKVLMYDMIKESATVLNNKTLPISMVNCKAARLGNKAFVFGYPQSVTNPPAYILDLDTLEVQLPPEDFIFPRLVDEPQVISNGYNYFLLGGWSNESDHQSDVPTDGIVRFDPEDFSWNFIKVENFPIQSYEHFWRPPSSIYIEKLNRIYSFGGMSRNFSSPNSGMVRDDIWYIDLSPLMPTEAPSTTTQRPDAFSCFNRPDGNYQILRSDYCYN